MPLAASGEISIGGSTSGRSINLEFSRAATATTSMSQLYRGGGIVTGNNTNVPTSGAISLSQFYNATRQFAFTIGANQTNADLRTLAVNAGWDQSAPVVATIGSGVYISSNNTGIPALTISGSFPSGVQLVNNGFIVGMGGVGGVGGGSSGQGSGGAAGGLALSVSTAVSINNAGTIGGGGGGGGGGQRYRAEYSICGSNSCSPSSGEAAGGGGGGGRTGLAANVSGGGLGAHSTGSMTSIQAASPGGTGTASSAGAGGNAQNALRSNEDIGVIGGAGGAGGNWGAGGASGATPGGRYGTGIPGNHFATPGAPYGGGGGGAAVAGNGNITWVATGTRLGAIT